MALKLKSVKADLAREEQGDWVEIPLWAGVAFKVASLYTPAYVTARDLLFQRLQKQYRGNPWPQDVRAREFGRLFVDHVLLDWRGLVEDDETPIAFSRERALEILTDPAYREVLEQVEWAAAEVGRVEASFVKFAGKNSAPPSATG